MRKRVIPLLICCMAVLTACGKADTKNSSSEKVSSVTETTEAETIEATAGTVTEFVSETGFPDTYTDVPDGAVYKRISYHNSSSGTQNNYAIIEFYDSHNNLLREVLEFNGELRIKECSYKYNSDNTVTEKHIVNTDGSIDDVVFEYNSDGTLAKETKERNGEFHASIEYTYNGHTEPVHREYIDADSEYNTSDDFTYEFDENGRITLKIIDSSASLVNNEEYYTYDENGNLKSITSGSTKIIYSYDENNRLIWEDHYLLDSWQSSTKYVYEFY